MLGDVSQRDPTHRFVLRQTGSKLCATASQSSVPTTQSIVITRSIHVKKNPEKALARRLPSTASEYQA
jgi:hypothetical protein